MSRPVLTEPLIRAAAEDAGNRHAKEHGHVHWNAYDWNAAVPEYERLMAVKDKSKE